MLYPANILAMHGPVNVKKKFHTQFSNFFHKPYFLQDFVKFLVFCNFLVVFCVTDSFVLVRSDSTFVNTGCASLLYRKLFRIRKYTFCSPELPHSRLNSWLLNRPIQAWSDHETRSFLWYPVAGGISLFWNDAPFLRDCTTQHPTRCHSSRNVSLLRLDSGNAVSRPIAPILYIRNFPMHPHPFLPSCDLSCFVLPLQETPGVENWWKRSVV